MRYKLFGRGTGLRVSELALGCGTFGTRWGYGSEPAWRVARAATIAELRGWAPIVGLQIEYSLIERTSDRELLPMAQGLGLGVVGWSPLAGGLLSGKYRRGEQGRATNFGRLIHQEDDPRKTATVDAVVAIAEENGMKPTQVSLAWMATRGVIPILGPRTPAQLTENLGATNVTLTNEQVARLDAASAVALGFPHDLIAADAQRSRLAGGIPDQVETSPTPVA